MQTSELHDVTRARPWQSVALAFAAGGCVALAGSRRPGVRALGATASAAIVEIVREYVKARARSWIDARRRRYEPAH